MSYRWEKPHDRNYAQLMNGINKLLNQPITSLPCQSMNSVLFYLLAIKKCYLLNSDQSIEFATFVFTTKNAFQHLKKKPQQCKFKTESTSTDISI